MHEHCRLFPSLFLDWPDLNIPCEDAQSLWATTTSARAMLIKRMNWMGNQDVRSDCFQVLVLMWFPPLLVEFAVLCAGVGGWVFPAGRCERCSGAGSGSVSANLLHFLTHKLDDRPRLQLWQYMTAPSSSRNEGKLRLRRVLVCTYFSRHFDRLHWGRVLEVHNNSPHMHGISLEIKGDGSGFGLVLVPCEECVTRVVKGTVA